MKNWLKRADSIFYVLVFVVIGVGLLLPKTGPMALLDELFDVLIIWIAGAYIIYKLVRKGKMYDSKQKIIRNIIMVCCIIICLWFSKGVALDVINGAKEETLSDVTVSRYQGPSGIISLHYYLVGTDESGDTIRLEISADDYSNLSMKRQIQVVYYENTRRVIECR